MCNGGEKGREKGSAYAYKEKSVFVYSVREEVKVIKEVWMYVGKALEENANARKFYLNVRVLYDIWQQLACSYHL